MNNEKYFSWNDTWVITAILWNIKSEIEIDLVSIIGNGDMLNHAIFTEEELKRGFYKAQNKGLISIKNRRITLLSKGKEIRDKVQNMKGGLFTLVDRMEKKLNSKRTKLENISDDAIDPCDFINEKSLRVSYEEYHNHFKNIR